MLLSPKTPKTKGLTVNVSFILPANCPMSAWTRRRKEKKKKEGKRPRSKGQGERNFSGVQFFYQTV